MATPLFRLVARKSQCTVAVPICFLLISATTPLFRSLAQAPATNTRTLPLSLGFQSAEPAAAYFDRRADVTPDRLPEIQRSTKEEHLRDGQKALQDPGLAVNGRQHDLSLRIVDYQEPFEALPSDYATAIVVGTLVSTHGFVSVDHTSVYTEHSFSTEQVIKADDPLLIPGTQLVGTRLGGTVHFNSGHVRDYATVGEGVPKVGQRYLLFLWRSKTSSDLDYGICTAFALQGGKAFALDAIMPFQQYDGFDEATLLLAASKSVASGVR